MRRNRIRAFHPVTRRNGVIASVIHRNRSVQIPVSFVTSLSGFALRFPVDAAQTSHASGPREARKTAGFNAVCGLRIADLSLRIADCGLRIDCGLGVDCGLRILEDAELNTRSHPS